MLRSHSDYRIIEAPMPKKQSRRQKASFLMGLQVGQAVLVDTRTAAAGIATRCRRLGYKVAIRQTEEGFGVWRKA